MSLQTYKLKRWTNFIKPWYAVALVKITTVAIVSLLVYFSSSEPKWDLPYYSPLLLLLFFSLCPVQRYVLVFLLFPYLFLISFLILVRFRATIILIIFLFSNLLIVFFGFVSIAWLVLLGVYTFLFFFCLLILLLFGNFFLMPGILSVQS